MRHPISATLRDLGAARRQSRGLDHRAHRPWEIPERSWLMGQSWLDLLFAHWRVDRAALERVVPPQLPIDEIDGSAWIGVTPFEVRALRLRMSAPAPFLSSFPELNVRTYVTVAGKPGIYFLSLDAGSRLAVEAARRAYRFPYFRADMRIERDGEEVRYLSSRRVDGDGPAASLEATYRPEGPEFNAAPDSLDWKLIERYCAYTLDTSGAVLRAEIHHPPWGLRAARADIAAEGMTRPFDISLAGEPLLHLARAQDVVIWPHERVPPPA
jgi:uncharacterized protein YqjF (DUF2071 family)